jgi:hypothetical protein
MAIRDPLRNFDLRTVRRHLRAGRVSQSDYDTFLRGLPDSTPKIRGREDGGDEDGYDARVAARREALAARSAGHRIAIADGAATVVARPPVVAPAPTPVIPPIAPPVVSLPAPVAAPVAPAPPIAAPAVPPVTAPRVPTSATPAPSFGLPPLDVPAPAPRLPPAPVIAPAPAAKDDGQDD